MQDVRDFKPSAIICDIAMPDEDGFSFMRKLRSMPARSGGKIPSIALTAMAGETDRIKAMEAGFQAHLAKPVHFERLLETIVALFK
jgi:CheY-like chemotaxis protein